MKPDIFATRALSPRDQFEAWREWYSSVFEVIPTDPISDGFPGEIRLWNLGGLAISRTIAGSSQISPTKRHVSRDPVDHIQRERLLEAHTILSNPEKTQSISDISEDLCFADPSGFSRTLQARIWLQSKRDEICYAVRAIPRDLASRIRFACRHSKLPRKLGYPV